MKPGYNFASGLLLAWLAVCSLIAIPVAANAFFLGGVSLKDEKEMGSKFHVALRSSMPFVDDPEVRKYVQEILDRLVKAMSPQPFEFHPSVISHPAINAFAIPGGNVYVFTGMLMNLNTEDELAGVLAHELAHVTQRHVAARMERAQALTLGSLLVAVAGIALGGPAGAAAAVTASGASQSALLNYSRIDESEADNLGLQYLTKAGYSPWGMVGGFKILRQKTWMSGVNIPTYLSTHPAIGDRVNSLSARVTAMPENLKNRKISTERFNRVKTLLWGRYGDEAVALQKFTDNTALSQMGRGMVLARQNRIADAAKAFNAALKLAPNDSLVLREAGIFHFRKGDMDRAESLLKQAIKSDPGDYMASFYYGRYLDEKGRNAEAAQYYKNVLRHVPEDPDVHEAYGRSLGNGGNSFQAYLHFAYSALYAKNRKLLDKYLKQARSFAKSPHDKSDLQKLETASKERKEIWDKS